MSKDDKLWKLKRLLRSLEKDSTATGIPDKTHQLERGLYLKLQLVEDMFILHAGRVRVAPSDVEMDVLMRAVSEEYDPVLVLQGEGETVHGHYVKRFLYWPKTEMKLTWKRPAVQIKIKGLE